MKVFRKNKAAGSYCESNVSRKTEICKEKLAAICVLSSTRTFAYVNLQVRTYGRNPNCIRGLQCYRRCSWKSMGRIGLFQKIFVIT